MSQPRSVASWQGAGEGAIFPKFWAVGKLPENFLFVEKCSFRPKKLGAKLKFWQPKISSVGDLHLSVGKLQLSAPPTCLTQDAADRANVRRKNNATVQNIWLTNAR